MRVLIGTSKELYHHSFPLLLLFFLLHLLGLPNPFLYMRIFLIAFTITNIRLLDAEFLYDILPVLHGEAEDGLALGP